MGFQSRHRDTRNEELAVELAQLYRLDVERAALLVRRAARAALDDPDQRSIRQWFAILLERDDADAAPGARSRPAALPGKRTLMMRVEAEEDAQAHRDAALGATPAAAHATGRLDLATQWRMSEAFGFDFSGVAIRPDSPRATGSTRAVVQDGEIHFRRGSYEPGSPDGDRLIAHELAHVVQQQRAGHGARTGSRRELEREADRAAALVARGALAPIALRAQPGAAYAFSDDDDHDETTADDQLDEVDAGIAQADAADADRRATREPSTDEGAAEASSGNGPDTDAAPGAERIPKTALPVEPGEAGEATGRAPGGGGSSPPTPDKLAPAVAGIEPGAGLAQLQGVRPDRVATALGDVHAAARTDVAKTRAEQRANPPKQSSTGERSARKAGTAAPGAPDAGDAAAADKSAPDKPVKGEVPGGKAAKQDQQAKATRQQEIAGAAITDTAHANASLLDTLGRGAPAGNSTTPGGANGEPGLTEAQTRELAGSVDRLPSRPADLSIDPGPAPELAMQPEAHTSADRDRAELETRAAQAQAQGRADSDVSLGEDHIATTVAAEELVAAAPPAGAAGADAALPTVAGAASSDEVGIVAQLEHGAEVDAALAKATTDVGAERTRQAADEAKARADADAQVAALKTKADADHAAARANAQAEVSRARGEWKAEIDKKGADARKQADAKIAEGMAHVEAEETKANAESRQHIEEGKRKAEEERAKGEKEAEDAKAKGKQKSSGFFGWVASKAKALFDGIKKALSAAIEACKRAVKAVLDGAKKLALAAIDLARKAITAAIKAIGEALIAISDVLLAAFPGLKAKFQALIHKAVDRAVALVNKIADALKAGVQRALDLLSAAIDKALSLLEKGLHFIVDAAAAVVNAAIKAAEAIVKALGTWAKLIKDVAAGPGSWIGKLGAAVVDGIKNHLWSAFKTAVVAWFQSKVMELLGLGGPILQILFEGGLGQGDIIQMALDALMVAIPIALVTILIEKLVSMIVPAAGAVMAILEGLQAAWGTISRIIAAFDAFMAFLLAVQSGNAGLQFATALAAAAIVVLDFVSNWLLKKLAGPARKVGKKLEGIANKFKGKGKGKGNTKPARPDAKTHPAKHDHDGPDAPAGRRSRDHDGPGGTPKRKHDADGPHGKPSKTKPDRKDGKDKPDKRDRSKQDQVAARRAAEAAARRGWADAQRRGTRELMSAGELRALLARATRPTAKVRVTLEPQVRGETWTVHAVATAGKSRATATAGHGWVARGPGGLHYAAENLTAFNKKLIADSFAELRRDPDRKDELDVRKAYDEKVRLADAIQRKHQAALDRKLRGLKLDIELEPFAGVEKDEKVRTKISVTPNTQAVTEEVPLDVLEFEKLYHVGKPTLDTHVEPTANKSIHLTPPKKPPMMGKEQFAGYAVNIAATWKEVRPDIAKRFTNPDGGAWEGSAVKQLAKLRTGVAVGINTYRRLDPKEDASEMREVDARVNKVLHPSKSVIAAFGFRWEPHWTNKEGATVPLAEVRSAWEKLPTAAKRKLAITRTENKVRDQDKLPYGIIRNQVVDTYGKQVAQALSNLTDPVHILIQDPDGGVQAANDMGVLAAYDEVLADIPRHPLMVIGGYRFKGFDWGDSADPRKVQLTELANEIDRAIRAAIAKIAPEALYPTEPNLLVKGIDQKHKDGLYDRDIQHGFGAKSAEGYELGRTVRARNAASDNPHPEPILSAPSTSITTDPVQDSSDRGLAVFPNKVDPSNPTEALERQKQSYFNPRTLEREIGRGLRVPRDGDSDPPGSLERDVYSRVSETGRTMVDPNLTPEQQRERIAQHHADVNENVDRLAEERKFRRQRDREKLEKVREICHAIIDVMTGDALKSTWERLKHVFAELEELRNQQPPAGGPG